MRQIILCAVAIVLSGTPGAFADVTVMSRTKSSGFRGWGASEGSQIEMTQGMRSRHEIKTRMTGKVLGHMTHDGDQVTLTLLDTEVIDRLNVPKKTYTETTFQQLRDQMKKAMEKINSQDSPEPGKSEKPSKPTHRISKAEFKVNATGASKTINGFPCKEYVVTMLMEIEDLKTGEKGQTRMITTLWTTPHTAAMTQVQKEQMGFAQAYMKKMDLALTPQDTGRFGAQMASALMGAGQEDVSQALKRVQEELKKINGYPIVTQVDWYIEPSAAEKARQDTSTAAEPADDPVDVTSVGGALSGIAGNWAKKKTAQKMQEHQKAQDGKPMISLTTEIESIATAAIPANSFAVPAGFKKIEYKR